MCDMPQDLDFYRAVRVFIIAIGTRVEGGTDWFGFPHEDSRFDWMSAFFNLDAPRYRTGVMIPSAISYVQLNVLAFEAYGSDVIKTFKISPDAFAQMALQLGVYKMTGQHQPCLPYSQHPLRQMSSAGIMFEACLDMAS